MLSISTASRRAKHTVPASALVIQAEAAESEFPRLSLIELGEIGLTLGALGLVTEYSRPLVGHI